MLAWPFTAPSAAQGKVRIGIRRGYISAETPTSYAEFQYVGRAELGKLRLVNLLQADPLLQKMGFLYEAAYLSEDHYLDYDRRKPNATGRASFLRSRCRRFFLMIPDESTLELMSSPAPEPGDPLTLEGMTLRLSSARLAEMPLKSFDFGRASPVYVQALSLQ